MSSEPLLGAPKQSNGRSSPAPPSNAVVFPSGENESPKKGKKAKDGVRKSVMGLRDQLDKREKTSFGKTVGEGIDIVQFQSAIFYGEESEGKAQLYVMRLGPLNGRVSCMFSTRDGSGRAGERYTARQGKLVFEDGEYEKMIEIGIIQSTVWSPTLEFRVELLRPDRCELGKYLFSCRIKVLDADCFPDNFIGQAVLKGEHHNIPRMKFISHYFWFCMNLPGVIKRSLFILTVKQLHNCYVVLCIFLNVYIIDVVSHDTPEANEHLWCSTRERTAVAMGALYIVPFLILHLADLYCVRLDLASHIRVYFQSALVRKYLNYDKTSRENITASAVSLGVLNECHAIVENGIMTAFGFLGQAGKLLIIGGFLATHNPFAVYPVFLFPLAIAFWIQVRNCVRVEGKEHVADTKEEVDGFVHEMCLNYQLIADYFQRPQINEQFLTLVSRLNRAQLPGYYNETNSNYVLGWVGTTIIAVFITKVSPGLADPGGLSVGAFLATMQIFHNIADIFKEMYHQHNRIMGIYGPLLRMCTLLNASTDLEVLKNKSRKLHAKSRALRSHVMNKKQAGLPLDHDPDGHHLYATDAVPIEITGVAFAHDEGATILRNVSIDPIRQGSLVIISGSHRSGKSTLLKMIAGTLHPKIGSPLNIKQLPLLFCANV
jgi:hypothetical protein